MDLDAFGEVKLPSAIQVQRRGARRLPNPREALALVLGALGTLGRMSGVKILNIELHGQPAALTIIEGAQFGEDAQGNTILENMSND